MPTGPIESFHILEEMYYEYKNVIEDLVKRNGLSAIRTKEYPPSPFETYCRFKFYFSPPAKLKIGYLYPYLVKINDVTLNLVREVKVLKLAKGEPSKELIPFKARFLLCSKFFECYHTENVLTEPKEVEVNELWITISAPLYYSRFLGKFIQKEKFWVEIRTY